MSHHGFLIDLSIVMVVAGVVTVIFNRIRLPVVLGYVLAGFLIGPKLLPAPLIKDQDSVYLLSELGVIFLLFSLGLEFSIRKLKAVGLAAVLAGAIEIGGMFSIGNLAARLMGWTPNQALFLGAVLAISSTTVIIKVLTELGRKREAFAEMVFGMLIVEDLAAIVLLAILSSITSGGTVSSAQTLSTLGQLLVFLVATLIFGLLLIPRFITWIAGFKNDEVLLITVLGLCLGFCAIVDRLEYSMALGAFLMGTLLAESRVISRIEALMSPLKDLFCAVFFVSVGLMINPATIKEEWWMILVLTVVLVGGKVFLCTLGAFVSGRGLESSLRTGMSMAQIGEFSYVIAGLGVAQGIVMSSFFSIVVSVSVLTTLSTPLLIRTSDSVSGRFLRNAPNILLSYIDLYSQWTTRFTERSRSSAVQKILRGIILKLTIFTSLIAGVFLFALFLARLYPAVFPKFQVYRNWIDTGLWVLALVLTMPITLAMLRKLRAFGLILAELGISQAIPISSKYYKEIRTVLSSIFTGLGIGLLLLYGGMLSSAILPPGGLVYLLGVLVVIFAYALRRFINQIYFQSKAVINEIFSRDSETRKLAVRGKTEKVETIGVSSGQVSKKESKEEMKPKASEADHTDYKLARTSVEKGSAMANKLLREAGLRENVGVSVMNIHRNSGSIAHPSPDEELFPGDSLLLFGKPAQLAEANALFKSIEQKNPAEPDKGPETEEFT